MTLTRTKIATKTKVIVGVAIAGLAAAAAISVSSLYSAKRCPWTCQEWTACTAEGIQTRTCRAASSYCARISKSPATSRACTPVELTGAYPSVSNAPLPTNVLTSGVVVANRIVASAVDGEAIMPGANFAIRTSRGLWAEPLTTSSSVRLSGEEVTLPGRVEREGCDGSMDNYCALHVVFAEPLVLAAGTSRTLELLLSVSPETLPCGEAFLTTNLSLPYLGDQTLVNSGPVCPSYASPRLSLNSLPSSVLSLGELAVANFRAAAPADRAARLDTVTFRIQKPRDLNISMVGTGLYLLGGGGIPLSGRRIYSSCPSLAEVCDFEIQIDDIRDVIPAGAVANYELRLNASGVVLRTGNSLSSTLIRPVELDSQVLIAR